MSVRERLDAAAIALADRHGLDLSVHLDPSEALGERHLLLELEERREHDADERDDDNHDFVGVLTRAWRAERASITPSAYLQGLRDAIVAYQRALGPNGYGYAITDEAYRALGLDLDTLSAQEAYTPKVPDLPLDARDLLAHYASRTGWDTDTLLLLALGYINNQDDDRAFLEHLERCAQEEEEASEALA